MFQILPQRIVPTPLMRMMKIAPSDAVDHLPQDKGHASRIDIKSYIFGRIVYIILCQIKVILYICGKI